MLSFYLRCCSASDPSSPVSISSWNCLLLSAALNFYLLFTHWKKPWLHYSSVSGSFWQFGCGDGLKGRLTGLKAISFSSSPIACVEAGKYLMSGMSWTLRKPITAGEEDSISIVWPLQCRSLPTHRDFCRHCCLVISKLVTVSHNDTKSVSFTHMGYRVGESSAVKWLLFHSSFCCFSTRFCCNIYATPWAAIIWTWSFSNRKKIRYWSWSGKLKLQKKSLIFSHCCYFLFSDSALSFSSWPSSSHRG